MDSQIIRFILLSSHVIILLLFISIRQYTYLRYTTIIVRTHVSQQQYKCLRVLLCLLFNFQSCRNIGTLKIKVVRHIYNKKIILKYRLDNKNLRRTRSSANSHRASQIIKYNHPKTLNIF